MADGAQVRVVRVHRQIFHLEGTTAMIQEHVPSWINNHKDAANSYHKPRSKLLDGAIRLSTPERQTTHVPYESYKEDNICTKREVVRCFPILVRRNIAASTEQSHQQQRPTSATKDAGHCPDQRRSKGDTRRPGRLSKRALLWLSVTTCASKQRIIFLCVFTGRRR